MAAIAAPLLENGQIRMRVLGGKTADAIT
ncbi:MAG: hypothetical protein RIQ28_442, partial [Pseudomonadota bacterium]